MAADNELSLNKDACEKCVFDPNQPIEEVISGTFDFKDDLDREINRLVFKFWRNIHSNCSSRPSSSTTTADDYNDWDTDDSNLEKADIVIECLTGTIKVNGITLEAGENTVIDSITAIPRYGNVAYDSGNKNYPGGAVPGITILRTDLSKDTSFKITATLKWHKEKETDTGCQDRDLYGAVACCLTTIDPDTKKSKPCIPTSQLFDSASWQTRDDLPKEYKDALTAAAERWSKYIIFDGDMWEKIINSNANWNGIALQTIDLMNPVRSQISCQPLNPITLGDSINTTKFSLKIDPGLKDAGKTAEDLADMMTRELGHALGLGFYWDPQKTASAPPFLTIPAGTTVNANINFLDGSKYPNAHSAYREITEIMGILGVPILTSSNNLYFYYLNYNIQRGDNPAINFPGIPFEIMTISAESSHNITNLSIYTLMDFGYANIKRSNEPAK